MHSRPHIRFLGKAIIFAAVQFLAQRAVNLVWEKEFILLEVEALNCYNLPIFPSSFRVFEDRDH